MEKKTTTTTITRSSLAFFLPNLGSEAGNLKDRGRWKAASEASEQAASLIASRSYQEGRERGRKERRGKRWREGGKGRLEQGSKKGSLQARKEGKNTAARIQRNHKPYASRQQKERERERERASSTRLRARQPPDLRESPPKHCLVLSAPAAP